MLLLLGCRSLRFLFPLPAGLRCCSCSPKSALLLSLWTDHDRLAGAVCRSGAAVAAVAAGASLTDLIAWVACMRPHAPKGHF